MNNDTRISVQSAPRPLILIRKLVEVNQIVALPMNYAILMQNIRFRSTKLKSALSLIQTNTMSPVLIGYHYLLTLMITLHFIQTVQETQFQMKFGSQWNVYRNNVLRSAKKLHSMRTIQCNINLAIQNVVFTLYFS